MEEIGIGAAELVGGAVVAGEDDDRVVAQPEVVNGFYDLTDGGVQVGNHRRIAGAGRFVMEVRSFVGVRVFRDFASVLSERFIGNLDREMGNDERQVQKEWFVFVFAQEFYGLFREAV